MNKNTDIISPCIGNCRLGPKDVCLGCFRSMNEILVWGRAGSEERLLIIEAALTRQKDLE